MSFRECSRNVVGTFKEQLIERATKFDPRERLCLFVKFLDPEELLDGN